MGSIRLLPLSRAPSDPLLTPSRAPSEAYGPPSKTIGPPSEPSPAALFALRERSKVLKRVQTGASSPSPLWLGRLVRSRPDNSVVVITRTAPARYSFCDNQPLPAAESP
eukprot:5860495-Pyramimonas_sp.AAC.3